MIMQRRNSGFTLIEIIVVLAVVSVLAAILFTVIGRVRENGRSAVCQNNLKQLALAIQQYAADSDGKYPGERFQSQLSPYIKPAGWIECPTHEAFSAAKPVGINRRSFYIYGYNYNGTRLTSKGRDQSGISFSGKHEATLPNATTTWVFSDDDPFTGGNNSGGGGLITYDNCGSGQVGWATLHSKGANYGFLDGHVKWLTPGSINDLHCSKQQ